MVGSGPTPANAYAVATGEINISEPTHQVFWNLSDMFSLNNQLYTAGQINGNSTLLAEVQDPNKIIPYDMDIEIDYTLNDYIDINRPALVTATVPPGRHIRIISLLDRGTPNYADVYFTDPPDGDFLAGANVNMPAAVIESGQPVTPVVQFRSWENSGALVPFEQHFKIGELRCQPFSVDSAGTSYCPYPDQQAIPAEKSPFPVVSIGLP